MLKVKVENYLFKECYVGIKKYHASRPLQNEK